MIWLGLATCMAWAVLIFGRGMFSRARDDDRDAAQLPEPAHWPAVQIIIPARDEAETMVAAGQTLVMQDYPGPFCILVVDDRGTETTGTLAHEAGAEVMTGQGRAAGWSGKLGRGLVARMKTRQHNAFCPSGSGGKWIIQVGGPPDSSFGVRGIAR